MFVPEKEGIFAADSMLRLEQAQSVVVPHLDARQFCLGDEVGSRPLDPGGN
jgi:hypothetical protein